MTTINSSESLKASTRRKRRKRRSQERAIGTKALANQGPRKTLLRFKLYLSTRFSGLVVNDIGRGKILRYAEDMNTHAQQNSCPIAIFGSGGHAVSVANVATSVGFRVSHFIDNTKTGSYLLNVPIVGDLSEIEGAGAKLVSIAIGDNFVRERVYQELISRDKDLIFPPLVHKSAVVSVFCEVAAGVVIMPGTILGPNTKIGRFCLLNTRSSIDHDSQMGDFSSLAPGVVTGGTVRIGSRSAISIGATIKHGISVGDDVVIGAGSYLNMDAPNNSVMYGAPARLIRYRANNDPYLQ